MVTDTHLPHELHTSHEPDAAPSATTAPPGRTAWILAGSLLAGMSAAPVLTLVVVGGAVESVITGALLTSFALSWAMIAVLTIRYADRPLRWALVPATVMGAMGVTLMVLAPHHGAMDVMAWVWPPAIAVLALWMFGQVRRTITGPGRWLLIPVLSILLLAAVGATYENVAWRHDQRTYAAPGQLHVVGDHRLHLDCRGGHGPTVVLFNGLGAMSASWARIARSVEQDARVCAYDRAGQGWSQEADHPQDGRAAAKELHALLALAGERGPYVLVGHSTGGTYAMSYAASYPEQTAGMVLLDSSSPRQFSEVAAYPGQYAAMRRGVALLPTLARLGVLRLDSDSHAVGESQRQVQALSASAKAARNMRDELSVVPEVFADARSLASLGSRPLAVLTADASLNDAGWSTAQNQLATLSTNHVHLTVHGTHAGLLQDDDPAAESAAAVDRVIAAVRNNTRVTTR